MNKKRNRSLNWDQEEKQLLRLVLKEYAQIIENKSLDGNTNKNKIKAWEEIHKKFNELNSRNRQIHQLKIQWKTMKLKARRNLRTFKSETTKTKKDLLNPAELLRDHNESDSDGLRSCSSNNEVESKPILDNLEIQQIANVELDTFGDDAQEDAQEFTSVLQLSDVEKITNMTTPIDKEIAGKTDHGDYVKSTKNQSNMLKDKEHERRMEMAEEEHAIAMLIQKEKLKCAILERQILELKKAREEKICNIFTNN